MGDGGARPAVSTLDTGTVGAPSVIVLLLPRGGDQPRWDGLERQGTHLSAPPGSGDRSLRARRVGC